jgi:hypothetical protein
MKNRIEKHKRSQKGRYKRSTRRVQRGGEFKNITIAILSWKAPQTIRNTLESYKQNNLLGLVKSLIYIQERTEEEEAVAAEYGIQKVLGTSENVGVLNAFIEMMRAVDTPYVIFAEDDFALLHDESKVRGVLADCMKLCSEKGVKYIRLRDRKNPGEPLYSRLELDVDDSKLEAHDYKDFPYKAEMVHFLDNPDQMLPDIFTAVNPPEFNYTWYLCDFTHSNWSSNIYMADMELIKNTILPILETSTNSTSTNFDKYHSIERILVPTENKQKLDGIILATGEGLFTHHRLDGVSQEKKMARE